MKGVDAGYLEQRFYDIGISTVCSQLICDLRLLVTSTRFLTQTAALNFMAENETRPTI